MSSATSARWSMPLVYTALLLEGGKERPQGGDEALRVLAGDVVARLDLDELQARVGGLHFLHRLGGVEIGARAAHGEQRAAHFADQLPHVDPELGSFRVSELVAKVGVALQLEIRGEVVLSARGCFARNTSWRLRSRRTCRACWPRSASRALCPPARFQASSRSAQGLQRAPGAGRRR